MDPRDGERQPASPRIFSNNSELPGSIPRFGGDLEPEVDRVTIAGRLDRVALSAAAIESESPRVA